MMARISLTRGRVAVFFLLVKNLVPVHINLHNAGYAWGDFNRDILAAFSKKLGGHPDRRTVILSRHAVDDLNLKLSFTSHIYLLALLASDSSVAHLRGHSGAFFMTKRVYNGQCRVSISLREQLLAGPRFSGYDLGGLAKTYPLLINSSRLNSSLSTQLNWAASLSVTFWASDIT